MHILIVTDQHPDSLGGAQVSIRLQRTFLERAGHTVSVVSPKRLNAPKSSQQAPEQTRGVQIDLPALPITRDRGYGASWPGARSARRVIRHLATLAPVDIVHVQGDFWGALIGYQVAQRLGVPLVLTLHNNLDVGTRAVTPLAPAVFWGLNATRRITLGPTLKREAAATGGWAYLAALAAEADAVVAPSQHFADQLAREGVPGPFHIIPTGVHDDVVDEIRGLIRDTEHACTRFVWCGRMSPEKRIIPLIEAFAALVKRNVDAELEVIGAGLQYDEGVALAEALGVSDRIHFAGPLAHAEVLRRLALSDALVQTSIGFETQGMTPYEATALGTPTVFSDRNILLEINAAPSWIVANDSVASLTETLQRAAGEIDTRKRSGVELRVPSDLADGMRQSRRGEEMIRLYERLV